MASFGANKGGVFGLIDGVYQGSSIQIMDLIELQQSRESLKLLVANTEPRRGQTWEGRWKRNRVKINGDMWNKLSRPNALRDCDEHLDRCSGRMLLCDF
jgi:hypothetical protein